MTKVVSFQIDYYQCLTEEAHLVSDLPSFAHDFTHLFQLYRNMVFVRLYDEQVIALQRTGQMGTFASSLGQEAIGAGTGHAMNGDDVLVPCFRESGVFFFRGYRVRDQLRYWGGDERGMAASEMGDDLPMCVPISTHTTQAAGVAYAIKYRKQQRAVVCMLGDGATSKGDFYESINLAGVWDLPVVYVINNNQWSISVPRSEQSRAETLAQKAIAAGIPGIQVDGNDVIAVRHVVDQALERARMGQGATVIEALSYRLCHHTTADDANRYRPDGELEHYQKFDPIERMKRYLIAEHGWSDGQDEALIESCKEEIEQEIKAFLAEAPQPASSMFDYLYETLPKELVAQREDLLSREVD